MPKRSLPGRNSAGFTMVEILVVVIIIAVLATMIVPRFFGKIGKAQHSVAKTKLVEIEKAIETFSYLYGQFPETIDDLVQCPPDIPEEKWEPPTLKAKDLLDAWDRQFIYVYPGNYGPYDLYSYGADGQEGGEKDNADIVNW